MIKLICFDLDGVIYEGKIYHFQSLNMALSEISPNFVISYEEHISIYDGLPTKKKLELLNKKGLNSNLNTQILGKKQFYTEQLLQSLELDVKLIDIFSQLKKKGYIIHVVSNAVRKTIEIVLKNKGIIKYVDLIISAESSIFPKPHPRMYLTSMISEDVGPKETLIIEDSPIGVQAGWAAGAFLARLSHPKELTMFWVNQEIERANRGCKSKWTDYNLNILIPMAGAGSRFQKEGYKLPKPLISVLGKPMIQVVVENLNINANYIFIVQKSHYEQYNLNYLLNLIVPECKIIQVDGLTEGSVCTTLLAKELIDNDKRLLIANADQYLIDWEPDKFFYSVESSGLDGSILVFDGKDADNKWSYTRISDTGEVLEVKEKQKISDLANIGIFYWSKGSDYVKYSEKMILENIRVNNEFYIAPTFQLALEDKLKFNTYKCGMMGLGVPDDLKRFEVLYNNS